MSMNGIIWVLTLHRRAGKREKVLIRLRSMVNIAVAGIVVAGTEQNLLGHIVSFILFWAT